MAAVGQKLLEVRGRIFSPVDFPIYWITMFLILITVIHAVVSYFMLLWNTSLDHRNGCTSAFYKNIKNNNFVIACLCFVYFLTMTILIKMSRWSFLFPHSFYLTFSNILVGKERDPRESNLGKPMHASHSFGMTDLRYRWKEGAHVISMNLRSFQYSIFPFPHNCVINIEYFFFNSFI